MKIFKAFTLIELLVVISIIGILAALLLANFAGIRDRADDAKNKSNLKQVQASLRMSYNDLQAYPSATDVACSGLTDVTRNLASGDVPATCRYSVGSTTDSFIACITLSNSADREAAESVSRCSAITPPATLTGTIYCVCSN